MDMNIKLESKPCPLGCPVKDTELFSGKDMLHNLPGVFNVVECATCGLLRTDPRPTQDTIGFYYPDEYGPYAGTRVTKDKSGYVKKIVRSLTGSVFDFKTTSVPCLPKGKMLEIGCASGAYMHKMAGEGWDVSGIEFSPKAAEEARSLGYDVYAGQLECAPDPSESYDLVVGWMVLEHLHDSVGGLSKLSRWTKPGASLVLSVPNAGSLEFGLFKRNWYALHLPNHLYHFTPSTIEKLLESSGWKVQKIHHQRTLANALSSMGYLLREKGYTWLGGKFISPPKYTNYALYPLAWLLSLFGQTGRMTIWATRA